MAIPVDRGALDKAETWFLEARQLAARGQLADAQEACRQALALWPDVIPVCRLLSSLAEQTGAGSGDSVEAARRMLLACQPDDATTANLIAAELTGSGRLMEALPFLRLAAPVLGHGDAALWNYTTTLALTGGHHELLAIEPMLLALARQVQPPFTPFTHLAGAKLALRHDRALVLSQRDTWQRSTHWLGAAHLAARLGQAIANGTSFSIFEMTEARTRLAVYASPKTQLTFSEGELCAVVNSVWEPAFGGTFESHDAIARGVVARGLLGAIENADIIAVPDIEQVTRAHEHFGFNAELQQIIMRRAPPLAAGLGVIKQMHQTMPFLRPLLAELPFLGFVGSTPGLVERLGAFCDVGATASYLVSGDQHATPLEQMLAALVVPSQGAVFLVAAGLLGPVYCGRIKQLGGIAIDVDSIAAGWTQSAGGSGS